MKNIPLRAGLGLLVLCVWGLGAHALGGETVPIKGRLTGSLEVTSLSSTEPVFRADYVASGVLSHLGRVNAVLSTPRIELDLIGLQLNVLTHVWVGTITAANGDQIFGSYATPEVIDFTPAGAYSFEVNLEILSGTGRFRGAQGQAVAVVTGNVFTQTYNVEIEGRISTVGSSKK